MLQFKGQNLDIAYEEKENSLIGLWGFDQLDTTGWFDFMFFNGNVIWAKWQCHMGIVTMSYGHCGNVIWA